MHLIRCMKAIMKLGAPLVSNLFRGAGRIDARGISPWLSHSRVVNCFWLLVPVLTLNLGLAP
jgi:hypothetical protein